MFIAQSFVKVECYVAQKGGFQGCPNNFFMESMMARIIITELDFVSGFRKYIIHGVLKTRIRWFTLMGGGGGVKGKVNRGSLFGTFFFEPFP